MNERTQRIIAISILIAGTLILAIRRFTLPHNYPDSLKYAQYVDIFLGRNTVTDPIPAPFIFRPLIPLIASLPSLFVDSITGLSVTSMAFSVLWVVVFYYICLEFLADNRTAFVVSGAALANPVIWKYAGSPLVDGPAMVFVGVVVLLTLREKSPYLITALVMFGSLAKELVLFAGLFYLLYRRDLKSTLPLIGGGCITLLYRYVVTGSISQPLNLHGIQPWFLLHTGQTLGALVVLALFGLIAVRDFDTVQRKLTFQFTIIGLLAFVPYMLMGIFLVYYGPRFAWPLQLALVPLAVIGAKYILDWFLEKLHLGKVTSGIQNPISDEESESDK